MQEVFNFIIRHFETLLSLVLIILSFVLCLLRKKPVSAVSDLIQSLCLPAVREAEEQDGLYGNQKLDYAVDYVCKKLVSVYPDLDTAKYKVFIKFCIEDILDTPQKKKGKK